MLVDGTLLAAAVGNRLVVYDAGSGSVIAQQIGESTSIASSSAGFRLALATLHVTSAARAVTATLQHIMAT